MKTFIHYMIIFCTKRVVKYQQRIDVLHNNEYSLDYIYAIGLMVVKRNIWLNKIKKLQTILRA